MTPIEQRLEQVLADIIGQQRAKLIGLARTLDPHMTDDDVLQPHDFPALKQSPRFQYEDGVLAGLLMAEALLRRELADPEGELGALLGRFGKRKG